MIRIGHDYVDFVVFLEHLVNYSANAADSDPDDLLKSGVSIEKVL